MTRRAKEIGVVHLIKATMRCSFFSITGIGIGVLIAACIVCTPTATLKNNVVETIPERPIVIIHGDTLVYQIAFTDKAERERFIYAFNQFLKEHSFLAQRYDSAGVFTMLRINPALPVSTVGAPSVSSSLEQEEKKGDVSSFKAIFEDAEVPREAAEAPTPGGSVRLYTPRTSLEYPLSALVDAYPFSERIGADSLNGYLVVKAVTATSITLDLAGKITSGNDKKITALDIVDLWTKYIRERPAGGYALFPFCQGIDEFIKGREAIIRGLVATDNATIRIKLVRPDPLALDRMRTPRAFPALFGLGRYAIKTVRESEDVLVANPYANGPRPYLDTVIVRRGGDANPMLSFSLGRYDALLLWSAADLDYARRNLLKNGTSTRVGRDRYFIALSLADDLLRAAICASLSSAELMEKFVKPEGALIGAIESDAPAAVPAGAKSPAEPPDLVDPVRIFYCTGDPISKIVAERLLASVTQKRIKAQVVPADRRSYEAALVSRVEGCFVGWAPENVTVDVSEKLRLATLYWNGDSDEAQRISQHREIPLFAIDWYLLAREKVGLYKGHIGGMYVKKDR